MIRYDHLLGRPFKHGTTDCFGLARDYFNQNFDLQIPNFARPNDWWDKGLDLYVDNFRDVGFRPVLGHPREWRAGDAVLMAIRSKTANHCGIFVEDGRLLHHFVGRLSLVEEFRMLWRDAAVLVLRHPKVHIEPPKPQLFDFQEVLPDAVRSQLAQAPVPR